MSVVWVLIPNAKGIPVMRVSNSMLPELVKCDAELARLTLHSAMLARWLEQAGKETTGAGYS